MIGHFHRGVHLAASFPCFSDKEMSHLQDRVSSEATLGDWVAWQGVQKQPHNPHLLSLLNMTQ